MKRFAGLSVLLLFPLYLFGQTDSLALRARPILSEQPIIFDPSSISGELDMLEQPVLKPRVVMVEKDFIQTRFESQEALKLTVPEVEVNEVRRSWSKILKQSADGRTRGSGNQLTANNVVFDEVTSDPYDVVMQFDGFEGGAYVWITLEADSLALSSEGSPAAFSAMREYLIYQGKIDYRDKVKSDIGDQEKKIDQLEKELDKTISKSEKLHKKISDNNIRIDETNQDIDENDIERKMISREVVEAKQAYKKAHKDLQKELKKEYKKVDHQKSKLEKDRKKYFGKIVDYKKEIEGDEQAITANLQEQKELLLEIKKEELMLAALQQKLTAI